MNNRPRPSPGRGPVFLKLNQQSWEFEGTQ